MALEWHETAPGLLYEAHGDSHRRWVIGPRGEHWMLDLFLDHTYETEQQTDPQPADSLEPANRRRSPG